MLVRFNNDCINLFRTSALTAFRVLDDDKCRARVTKDVIAQPIETQSILRARIKSIQWLLQSRRCRGQVHKVGPAISE